MASDVDICNLSLAHLGDDASVTCISPPDGSVQAMHCARFYPLARDVVLAARTWAFATRRTQLALLTTPPPAPWKFAYALPPQHIRLLGIYDANSLGDIDGSQEFTTEADANGRQVIYTNQQDAICNYTARAIDSAQFSPLFIAALAWLLASYLAGPMLKGDAGASAGLRCSKMYQAQLEEAATADAKQVFRQSTHTPSWIANR